jgi:hypothetical protein
MGVTNAEGPLAAEPPASLPAAVGLELTAQQRSLLEALRDVDEALGDVGLRLGPMYLGALAVLRQPFNGERFAQAAHTLREIIDRLPRVFKLATATPYERERFELATKALDEKEGNRLQKPQEAWEGALKRSKCFDGEKKTWSGAIDDPLRRALVEIQKFFAWKEEHRPRRDAAMAQVIRHLDKAGIPLPGELERGAVDQWSKMRDYFIHVAHHRVSVDEAGFSAKVDAFELFLLDRLRPRTFADFDAIDAIVEEAERGG